MPSIAAYTLTLTRTGGSPVSRPAAAGGRTGARFPAEHMQPADQDDRLRFHWRCGTLVKLSPNNRSAKRLRAFDEFNNGVVMTNRNVRDDELFEVGPSVRCAVDAFLFGVSAAVSSPALL